MLPNIKLLTALFGLKVRQMKQYMKQSSPNEVKPAGNSIVVKLLQYMYLLSVDYQYYTL